MDASVREQELTRRLRINAIAMVVLSVWLFLSPFVLGYDHLHGSTWSAIGVAWVGLFVAGLRVSGGQQDGWLSWLQTLIGLFLIASPWIWGDAGTNLAHVVNAVVVGAIIAGLGVWTAITTPTLVARTPMP